MLSQLSFRTKTVLGIVSITAVLLIFLVSSSLGFLKQLNDEQLIYHAKSTSTNFANTIKDAVLSHDLETLHSAAEQLISSGDHITFIRIFDHQKTPLAEFSSTTHGNSNETASSISQITAPINIEHFNVGYVQIGFNEYFFQHTIESAKYWGIGLAIAEIVLVGILALLLGNYLTRHMRILAQGAKEIEAGKLGLQIPVVGTDEIAQVTQSLNALSLNIKKMRDELEARVIQRTAELDAASETLQGIFDS
ncbi:MAG: HAMP domain-containing protein, partial [Zetaproteobacteria bacterium]|nr:HAMP domain-containing protein [Zetaproteobacteria bacterium]